MKNHDNIKFLGLGNFQFLRFLLMTWRLLCFR